MAHPLTRLALYPAQDAPGQRWHWILERLEPEPAKAQLRTVAEGKKALRSAILDAHENGFEVIAEHTDQTGAGHRAVYDLKGRMVEEAIPSPLGLLGPRCSVLPRGDSDKAAGEGAGGLSASERRRTLAARFPWVALLEDVREGKLLILPDGSISKASKRGAAGLTADERDYQYIAARIIARTPDARRLGSFPASFTIPEDITASQRTAAAVQKRAKAYGEKLGDKPKPKRRRKPKVEADKPSASKKPTAAEKKAAAEAKKKAEAEKKAADKAKREAAKAKREAAKAKREAEKAEKERAKAEAEMKKLREQEAAKPKPPPTRPTPPASKPKPQEGEVDLMAGFADLIANL